MRTQLALKSVTKRYDDRVVLDQVSITVAPGEKVGVIGDNGSGKSTLLRLLAGRERADNGDVTVLAPGGLGYLAQTVELPARATVQDAIDLALSDLHDLASRVRHAEAAMAGVSGSELDSALAAYAELVADFEARGGYDAELRVEIAAHHLGVPGLERDRPWETLSGGERSRLALAAVVAADPELLLLDEPTNDLDDDAMTWLETRLREHRGAVVVVTHDRVFLERLSSTILEVEAGRVSRHGDGYHGYLAAKAAERSRRLQQFAAWSADLARNQRLVAANVARLDAIPHKTPFAVFGHGAFRSRSRGHGAMGRIRNAKERVERLTARPVAPPPERLAFTARLTTAATEPVVAAAELHDVRVAGRIALSSWAIGPGERCLVTGPNGAGKTTLLRVLAGALRPDAGHVHVRGRVGHLRQEDTAWPPGLTVQQAFALGREGAADEHAATLLALGLLAPADLRLRVDDLSYGQRRRIELARLVTEPVDLLLLDEPTNHFSPALVEELDAALADYRGALVVVTHDRRMRSRFVGSHLRLEAGRVVSFRLREPTACSTGAGSRRSAPARTST